jgi:hypothetical protein
MDMATYGRERRDQARATAAIKQSRRMEVGPYMTCYFENYQTMWFQVHEMLHIEKGGEAQIAGELEAYNPLIPNGRELVATLMIEIGDPDRRARELAGLGGFEETVTITVNGETIAAVAEKDVDRTNAAGKASSVQFLHFPFTDTQIAAFRQHGAEVTLVVGHAKYRHAAVLPETIRAALAGDFD